MAAKAGGAGNHHLTKEELFEELKVNTKPFKLPGGGFITLQSVPLRHIDKLQGVDEKTETHDALKRICLLGIREPELEVEDLERLDDSQAGLINDIANEIMVVSGMLGDRAKRFLQQTQEPKRSSATASKSSEEGSPAS